MEKGRQKVGLIEVAIVLAIVLLPTAVGIRYWIAGKITREADRRARGAAFLFLYYARCSDRLPPACTRGPSGQAISSWRFAAYIVREIPSLKFMWTK